jgi:hypothetical protein
MTPILTCAHDVTMKLLDRAGHKFSFRPDGDPIARWASAIFHAVDDPGMLQLPPAELPRIGERVERGLATPQEQLVFDTCALPLFVWTRMDDALAATPDPEGDGSPEEHDADRAKRAAAWESAGKAKALATIEAGLAEILPKIVSAAIASKAVTP